LIDSAITGWTMLRHTRSVVRAHAFQWHSQAVGKVCEDVIRVLPPALHLHFPLHVGLPVRCTPFGNRKRKFWGELACLKPLHQLRAIAHRIAYLAPAHAPGELVEDLLSLLVVESTQLLGKRTLVAR
jgi:hypothetical protein